MIRYFLAKGDRAGDAVITEGLSTSTYQDADGRRVELATVYMQTYCHACKKSGFICPSGPRLPGTAENGKQHALSGDINICDCKPPPAFFAVRNMTESITTSDIERMDAVYNPVDKPLASSARVPTPDVYDQYFLLRDERTGDPLIRMPYKITTEDGQEVEGHTDASGHTQKIVGNGALQASITVFEGHAPINPDWDK